MPDHLSSFKLDFLTPDLFAKIVKRAVAQGTPVKGNHGTYINFHMGDMLLIIRTAFDREKGLDYITGFDSHAKGCCVWDCVIAAKTENDDVTAKTVIIKSNNVLLPLPLINGDILPSYAPGAKFKAQVAAYPHEISCYSDEAALAANENAAVGAIAPHDDQTVTICGKALGFREGQTVYMGGVMTKFIVCLVCTDHGDLELVFPAELIKEEAEKLLIPGAYVCCRGELAANPAILSLEKGVPPKEETI